MEVTQSSENRRQHCTLIDVMMKLNSAGETERHIQTAAFTSKREQTDDHLPDDTASESLLFPVAPGHETWIREVFGSNFGQNSGYFLLTSVFPGKCRICAWSLPIRPSPHHQTLPTVSCVCTLACTVSCFRYQVLRAGSGGGVII